MSDIVERLRASVEYSHNFATAKPDIGKTEYEHIAGLCSVLTEAVEELERVQRERDALRDGIGRCYRMLQSEPDTKGALFKAENILRDLCTAAPAPAAVPVVKESLTTDPVPASDARDAERLREALSDLLSWFPEKPSPPEWRIIAGENGADAAIEAAREAMREKGEGGEG